MESLNRVVVCFLFVGVFVTLSHGQGCTFPSDLNGIYDSSLETTYQMEWNSTHVYPFDVDTQSLQFFNLTFECNYVDGTYYIARSEHPISIYTVPYYVYTCWVFERLSDTRYVYYQATSKLASAANKNYKIYPIAYPTTSALICDQSAPYYEEKVALLVKKDSALSDKATCPVSFWGQYVYRMEDTTGTASCYYNSYMDVCTSTDTVTINTTLCSTPTLYSTGGTLYCMFEQEHATLDDTYYIYLYNNDTTVDNTNTFKFTCVMMHYSASETKMTQHPNYCLSAQTATSITTAPGAMFSMFANVTCPPTSESSSFDWVPVIAGVVAFVVIVIVVIVAVIYYKKVYLPKKKDSAVSPDTLHNTSMSTTTADKNYRMMFTPAPPKSAVPGKRGINQADGGSRAASAASLRPTVSALATYRTPSPFTTEGKDIDVDSLLDYDYTTKQNLGDPDGAESGVMLEMEGSLPVYSELGDTPEPTTMTPTHN